MFTGLVEEVGKVRSVKRKGEYQLLNIDARKVMDDIKMGDSIAVNGVCQTVIGIDESGFSVETLAVTLKKTSLGTLKKGMEVNLERALRADSRMGGHMVQGHVDGLGRVSSIRRTGENVFLEVILPKELMQFCASEGSIALDGISLTIAELRGARITANIIPATWEHTILKNLKTGDQINIEVDMMARYVARILEVQLSHTSKGEHNE